MGACRVSGDRLVNATAEAALLGAMLLENQLVTELSDRVIPEDFGDPVHGRIMSAMLKFAAVGKPSTALTLRPVFAHDGDAQYGDYLEQLIEAPAVVAAAEGIADQVADLSARRKARAAMQIAIDQLHNEYERPVDEICGQVESVAWAAANRTRVDEALDAGQLAGLVEERANRVAEEPGAAGMTNALIEDLDRGLGDLEPGTYNIVAARPGMGKSALASSAALGYAISGHAGLYLQHEMTAEQMALRATSDLSHAMNARVPHKTLRKGQLNAEDRHCLRVVRDRAGLLPIRYVSPGPCDVRRVWSLVAQHRAMWAARGRKLELVVVDYLGLLDARDAEGRAIEDDRKRINAVSKTLKRMAHELEVAVIALAQLSRGVEQRQSKRPFLSDLKESGNLEQDADTVTLLYREEYYLEQEEPKRGDVDPKTKRERHEDWETELLACRGKIDLIFAKNRHGRSSTRTAKFLAEYSAVRSGAFDEFAETPLLI
jgi:replicative DNA helicase